MSMGMSRRCEPKLSATSCRPGASGSSRGVTPRSVPSTCTFAFGGVVATRSVPVTAADVDPSPDGRLAMKAITAAWATITTTSVGTRIGLVKNPGEAAPARAGSGGTGCGEDGLADANPARRESDGIVGNALAVRTFSSAVLLSTNARSSAEKSMSQAAAALSSAPFSVSGKSGLDMTGPFELLESQRAGQSTGDILAVALANDAAVARTCPGAAQDCR